MNCEPGVEQPIYCTLRCLYFHNVLFPFRFCCTLQCCLLVFCRYCCSRWSRRPLANYHKAYSTEPDHKNLVTFGKYTGLTYQKAYEDPKFVQSAIDRAEMEDYPPPYIHTFVRYCKLRKGSGGCSASSDVGCAVWHNGTPTTSTNRTKTKPKAKPTAKPKESHSIHSSPTHSDVEMVSGVTHYVYDEEDL